MFKFRPLLVATRVIILVLATSQFVGFVANMIFDGLIGLHIVYRLRSNRWDRARLSTTV